MPWQRSPPCPIQTSPFRGSGWVLVPGQQRGGGRGHWEESLLLLGPFEPYPRPGRGHGVVTERTMNWRCLALPLTNWTVLLETQLSHLQSKESNPASQGHCLSQTVGGQGIPKFRSPPSIDVWVWGNAVSTQFTPCPSTQVYEVVRPLVSLLDTQRDGLQNYEALLGLTNLSGRSDRLR